MPCLYDLSHGRVGTFKIFAGEKRTNGVIQRRRIMRASIEDVRGIDVPSRNNRTVEMFGDEI